MGCDKFLDRDTHKLVLSTGIIPLAAASDTCTYCGLLLCESAHWAYRNASLAEEALFWASCKCNDFCSANVTEGRTLVPRRTTNLVEAQYLQASDCAITKCSLWTTASSDWQKVRKYRRVVVSINGVYGIYNYAELCAFRKGHFPINFLVLHLRKMSIFKFSFTFFIFYFYFIFFFTIYFLSTCMQLGSTSAPLCFRI